MTTPEHGRNFATFSEEPGADTPVPPSPWRGPYADEVTALDAQWRTFGRVATGVAVLTSPALFLLLTRVAGIRSLGALILTVLAVFAFRGLVDVVTRRYVPSAALMYEDAASRDRDISDRRRVAFWRSVYRMVTWISAIYLVTVAAVVVVQIFRDGIDLGDAFLAPLRAIRSLFASEESVTSLISLLVAFPIIFLIQLLMLFGPMMYAGIRQVRVFEPGDANWGARVDDVRGQASAKEAVRKLVTLWQSGDQFERAGGKRERGVLFIGPPGTGKTMLGKALASNFNCPFLTVPGTAFNQAFLGVDVLIVMWVTWRARRLSRKWGGQCIVFMDEIDSIGGRRSTVLEASGVPSVHESLFFGPMGALTPTGDLVLETAEWRDRLFRERGARPASGHGGLQRLAEHVRNVVAPNAAGWGQGALQQLLVEMDGIASPPIMRTYLSNRVNTFLDATYVIPPRVGAVRLRLAPVRPRREDVFFIGACNVPVSALDPALTRPGRFGRSIEFRAPDRRGRLDIIDLYLEKVAHEPDLDTPARRTEFARISMGHSPAMIQQVCSLALTHAHFDGRERASWHDIVEAIATISYGVDRNLEIQPDEARATALHEAGHAVTGHTFMKERTSTRLSIRARSHSLGHHAMAEIEERHSQFAHHHFADLVWTLGAMASELVFYGETTSGVSGDLTAATAIAERMVGNLGMAAPRPDLSKRFDDPTEAARAEAALLGRYRRVGQQIMNRAASWIGVTDDPAKHREATTILGQAFMTAYWFVRHNRDATEKVAETLLERQELYGDEVNALLDSVHLAIPDIDPLDEANWPRI